jgi:alcohol dehydrogenase class IV
MQFEFATATKIVFGPGPVKEVAALATPLGKHALVVTGKTQERAQPLLKPMEVQGISVTFFAVPGEPTTAMVREGVAQARAAGCDLVIGIGGGSVLDAGKAIAALLTNGGDPLDYLEVVGRGSRLPGLPRHTSPFQQRRGPALR